MTDDEIDDKKNLPEYEPVDDEIDFTSIDDVHDSIDSLKSIKPSIENVEVDDDGNNGYDTDVPDVEEDVSMEDVSIPESYDVAAHKYNIEPDIAPEQQHEFGPNRAFFGRHVVNSNTLRKDNPRHLWTMDLCDDYDLIPTRRQRGHQLRQRTTAEFQMSRSNQELGGFDRKLQRSVIKKEDVDLKQTQTVNRSKKKRKGLVSRIIGGR